MVRRATLANEHEAEVKIYVGIIVGKHFASTNVSVGVDRETVEAKTIEAALKSKTKVDCVYLETWEDDMYTVEVLQ